MNNQCFNTYEFISQACNSLLTNCPKEEGDFFNAIKVTSHKIKTTTKTILTKGKGSYNKVMAQQTLTSLQLESTEAIRLHSKKLFEQLFRNRIKNISQRIKLLLDLEQEQSQNDSKFILFNIIEELDSQYDDLKVEMQQAKKYSKVKQFKDVLNLEILNPTENLYISQMFRTLPGLQTFLQTFHYQQLTLTQIYEIITYKILKYAVKFDFNNLIAAKKSKSISKKQKKKKNKKKKNQQRDQGFAKQQENCQLKTDATQSQEPSQSIITQIRKTVFPKQRLKCYFEHNWLEEIKGKFIE